MAAVIPTGTVCWGTQLPVQSQSTAFVRPWEAAAGPAELLAVAQAADRAGAFYVAVCDHVAIPRPLDEAMSAVWYDTVATLGWLAGQTEHVHLLSHVWVVGYRAPLVTAKAFSTLDVLSGGRAILGVGAGHVEREFELLGASFADRGRVLDESLAVIREAFGAGEFGDAIVAPRSPRPDGPPIWVGGSSGPALRRAARLGDGWLPQGPPKMGMRGAMEFIRNERAEHFGEDRPFDMGINAGPLHIGPLDWDAGPHTFSGSPEEIAARMSKLAALGANQIQVGFPGRSCAETIEQIERFGAEVWPLVG